LFSSRSGGSLASTLAIKNTKSAVPAKVKPLALRFGSNSGRRTITGSKRRRSRNRPPTTNIHW
jgi:hypothetical protein